MTPRFHPSTLVGAAVAASLAVAGSPAATAKERTIQAYTTGYTWYDNTPRGSVAISHPVVHKKTAGTGTAKDPITVAVGHSLATGEDVLDYAPGTRMYIPAVRKYFVVEDTCGDGDTPEDGPCHSGYEQDDTTYPWLDLWIDGAESTNKEANRCASRITDVHTVILDPAPTYAVVPGSVTGSGCTVYSDTPVTAASQQAQASDIAAKLLAPLRDLVDDLF